MALPITFLLGLFVLAGAAVAGCARNQNRIRELSIAVAAGAIAVLLVCDLLPEVVEGAQELGWPKVLLGIVAGVGLLAALDRFLPEPPGPTPGGHAHDTALHVSIAATIALSLHNIVEGMSVYATATEDLALALMLAFGIGVHNVPMGMIVYAGVSDQPVGKRVAVLSTAALSTFVGGLIMRAMRGTIDEGIVAFMITLTVGLLLYILVFELLPHLLHAHDRRQAMLGFLVGAAPVFIGVSLTGMAA